MILSSWTTLIVVALWLLLGLDVLVFGVAVLIPSITVTQMMMFRIVLYQTNDMSAALNAGFYASLLIAGLWFIGFILRYARGKTIASLVPMPEYAKLMIVGVSLMVLASTDVKTLADTLYNYLVMLVFYPLLSFLGDIGSMLYMPIALLLYTVTSSYVLRAIEKVKGSSMMVASIASAVVGGISLLTLTVASGLMSNLMKAREELAPIAAFLSFGIVMIAILSLRELRAAFVELRPEAIVQIPVILSILRPYILGYFPELYVAIELVVAGLAVALNAAGAIAGLGLGSRRVLVGTAALNSALLFTELHGKEVFRT